MVRQALSQGHLGLEVWRQSVPPYSSFHYQVPRDRGEIVGLVLRKEGTQWQGVISYDSSTSLGPVLPLWISLHPSASSPISASSLFLFSIILLISSLHFSSCFLFAILDGEHPQQVDMITTNTRNRRAKRAMAKYEVEPSMSTFNIFLDSSTVAVRPQRGEPIFQ